jgi:signal transduction histidine kinase
MKARPAIPIALGLVSLLGSLVVIGWLYARARGAVEDLIGARLVAAGESAALLFESVHPTTELLARLRGTNDLDAAYVIDPEFRVSKDASGSGGHPLDLLRIDSARLDAAFHGRSSVGFGYDVAGLEVLSGYFPIRDANTGANRVLALEAGRALKDARQRLDRASAAGALLSLLTAAILGLVARRWLKAEASSRTAAERAARGQAVAAMAAMAAHEIRNPLGVIRGTVELMEARSGQAISERDRTALKDVLGEVERLRRLTEDFLDLSTDRPIAHEEIDLSALLEDAAHAAENVQPQVAIARAIDRDLRLVGDAGRLRQVFANLLQNAADAQGQGRIELTAKKDGAEAVVVVHDFGRGIPPEVRVRLFDPFFTTRSDGTGLGLAITRRHVDRHGGSIRLKDEQGPGTAFEVRLPLSMEVERT